MVKRNVMPGRYRFRHDWLKTLSVSFFILLSILLLSATAPADGPAKTIKIVASVFPLHEFAREVAGKAGEVSLLLPPGANVHTWQPRPSDLVHLSRADLFVFIGQGLEPWVGEIMKAGISPGTKVLTVTESLARLGRLNQAVEKGDPHIWLDLEIDRAVVNLMAATLGGILPEGATEFEKNAALYNEKLKRLDDLYAASLGRCRQSVILIGGHAAFGYLAVRYGLRQISLLGLSPDAGSRPGRMAEIISWAKKNAVGAVFKEANAVDRTAIILAAEIGSEVLELHTGANLTQDEWRAGTTFLELMERNLVELKKGLGCD